MERATRSEHGATMIGSFGQELILDLYNCDLDLISDADTIRKYAIQLVDVIKMKAYGPPQVEYFGLGDWKIGDPVNLKPSTAGYTLVQLIETSNITAHFSEANLSAHFNIFSCRYFNYDTAMSFTEEYFRANRSVYTRLVR